LQKVYKQAEVAYQGPLLTCAERVSNNVIKVYSDFSPLSINGPDNKVQGFAISEDNLKYHWVEGELHPNYVLLQVKNADKIAYVSYAWQSNPTRANLTNSQLLPAYPAKLVLTNSCESIN
jgi:hypothetical protein